MAKILITIDTEEDEMEVNVEGQSIPNVKEVCCLLYDSYEDPGEQELSVRITSYEQDPNSGITKMTYLMAKDRTGETENAKASTYTSPANSPSPINPVNSVDFHGLVKFYSNDVLKSQISNLLKKAMKK